MVIVRVLHLLYKRNEHLFHPLYIPDIFLNMLVKLIPQEVLTIFTNILNDTALVFSCLGTKYIANDYVNKQTLRF